MPSQRVPIPSAEIRAQIGTSLEALVRALEAHPLWTPPTPPPGIFYVWDFANRSKYINSEIDNVLAGKDVKHPDQFSKDTRDPDPLTFAEQAFGDVISRSGMVTMLVQNPAMLMSFGVSQVDFGDHIRTKAQEVDEAIAKAK